MTKQEISEIRDEIFSRLHDKAGICITCGKPGCEHGKSTKLPHTLDTEIVLLAINEVFSYNLISTIFSCKRGQNNG